MITFYTQSKPAKAHSLYIWSNSQHLLRHNLFIGTLQTSGFGISINTGTMRWRATLLTLWPTCNGWDLAHWDRGSLLEVHLDLFGLPEESSEKANSVLKSWVDAIRIRDVMWQASYISWGHEAAGGHHQAQRMPNSCPSYLTVFAVAQALKGLHTPTGGLLQLLVPLHCTVLHLHLKVWGMKERYFHKRRIYWTLNMS